MPIKPPQRKPRQPRKLDRAQAKSLRDSGMTMPQIAAKLGVNVSTVYRFLDRTLPEFAALEAFKQHRANVFADLQQQSIDLQQQVIKSFRDGNGNLIALTPQQKSHLLQSLNAVSGTIYDKERLESGKSTQNVGIVARMMGDAFDSAYLERPDQGSAPK